MKPMREQVCKKNIRHLLGSVGSVSRCCVVLFISACGSADAATGAARTSAPSVAHPQDVVAKTVQTLTPDSYWHTCTDIQISLVNRKIEATCQRIDGTWTKTSLGNFNTCSTDISNDNGDLKCGGNYSVPDGPYLQTCATIKPISCGAVPPFDQCIYASCITADNQHLNRNDADITACNKANKNNLYSDGAGTLLCY
jgi:hypothetical protein